MPRELKIGMRVCLKDLPPADRSVRREAGGEIPPAYSPRIFVVGIGRETLENTRPHARFCPPAESRGIMIPPAFAVANRVGKCQRNLTTYLACLSPHCNRRRPVPLLIVERMKLMARHARRRGRTATQLTRI